jgi:NADPH:quinone reductase
MVVPMNILEFQSTNCAQDSAIIYLSYSYCHKLAVPTAMSTVMRAIVLSKPGPVSNFELKSIPIPVPQPGWVLIRVKAFGLNRSELHTRLGLAEGVTFPRVLGIEATGVVAKAPGGEFSEGQQVSNTATGVLY